MLSRQAADVLSEASGFAPAPRMRADSWRSARISARTASSIFVECHFLNSKKALQRQDAMGPSDVRSQHGKSHQIS